MDLPLLMAVEFSKQWAELNIDIFTSCTHKTSKDYAVLRLKV
jgi:hypothetical protein